MFSVNIKNSRKSGCGTKEKPKPILESPFTRATFYIAFDPPCSYPRGKNWSQSFRRVEKIAILPVSPNGNNFFSASDIAIALKLLGIQGNPIGIPRVNFQLPALNRGGVGNFRVKSAFSDDF